jgi:fluoroquinolone transport system ATP-binding protein
LDEPTNGLDPTNAMILKDMIREFKAMGGTVFLTSHIMSDVDQLCDRVAFVLDGKIIEMDSPRNLKLKYGKRTLKLEYRDNGKTTIAEFPMDGIGQNQTFLRLLQTKTIETIHSGETSLEDIFIKVTGVGLSDE